MTKSLERTRGREKVKKNIKGGKVVEDEAL